MPNTSESRTIAPKINLTLANTQLCNTHTHTHTFNGPFSGTTILSQSSLPARPHSWLPSTNPPDFTSTSEMTYTVSSGALNSTPTPTPDFTLASLHFLSPLFFSPFLFHASRPHIPSSSLPTHVVCPYSCYIGLYFTISSYTGFASLSPPAPHLSGVGVVMRPLSPRCPITGRL